MKKLLSFNVQEKNVIVNEDEIFEFESKLKDLKSQNSLSNMFNDSDDGMLDYYDLSHSKKDKKNKKQKEFNNKKREFEKNKIFELTNITKITPNIIHTNNVFNLPFKILPPF